MPLSQALAAHLRVSEQLTARRAMPDEDEALGWVRELATTKIFGSREQNVLGLENFDDGQLFVLRGLLEGLTVQEIQTRAANIGPAAKLELSIADVANHIRNLSLFKSIFVQDGD